MFEKPKTTSDIEKTTSDVGKIMSDVVFIISDIFSGNTQWGLSANALISHIGKIVPRFML